LELSSTINEFFSKSQNVELANFAKSTFIELGKIFGLFQKPRKAPEIPEKLIDKILDLREELRRGGEFKLSDRLREVLRESGIEVEDTPQGPKWKVK
jgi:cysteinyl-tRNA synthetase